MCSENQKTRARSPDLILKIFDLETKIYFYLILYSFYFVRFVPVHCTLHLPMFQTRMLAKTLLSGVARTLTRSVSTTAARLGGDTMVLHKDTPENNADTPFAFSEENKSRADAILSIYPDGHKRAAVRY